MERKFSIALALVLAGCSGGNNSGDDSNDPPPNTTATEVTADLMVNVWDGPIMQIASAGRKEITISFRPEVSASSPGDIIRAVASFSGAGEADGPIDAEWDLQASAEQELTFTVVINAADPGPWALQPQIHIQNPESHVILHDIKAKVVNQ